MAQKIKLGLTRNRLFEFDNCVYFLGTSEVALDKAECEKALKQLFVKYSLLSAAVELDENGDAFLVTEKAAPEIEVLSGDLGEIIRKKRAEGICFSKRLFSFALINESTLGIFAHTLVADSRALASVACDFMGFYNKKLFDLESEPPFVFSESGELPSNVFSVVIDRLASGLDIGWQKKSAVFTEEDYKAAREAYISEKGAVKKLCVDVSENILLGLRSFSQRESVDVTSLISYAFFSALYEKLQGKRKYKKLNVQANERVFFEASEKMKIGAFNGYFSMDAKSNKNPKASLSEKAVSFHKDLYKKVTSAFIVFYNEMLLFRLPGPFCDSQYMAVANKFKNRFSKKLAYTYGCANEVMGELCAYNFSQGYWRELSVFSHIELSEPLKMRSSSLITYVEKDLCGIISFEFKTDKISEAVAQGVLDRAVKILEQFK